MKEVEITGTIQEIYAKLKTHIGQKVCQYSDIGRSESILGGVSDMLVNKYQTICLHLENECENDTHIFLPTKSFGMYSYVYGVSPPIFLCLEVDETFEEMTRRKQEEIFQSLK